LPPQDIVRHNNEKQNFLGTQSALKTAFRPPEKYGEAHGINNRQIRLYFIYVMVYWGKKPLTGDKCHIIFCYNCVCPLWTVRGHAGIPAAPRSTPHFPAEWGRPGKEAAPRYEFFGGAFLCQRSLVQHGDFVRPQHGAEAVGDDHDYCDTMKALFLAAVERAKKKFRFQAYNFCIMGNHVHLIIRPDRGESLSCIMQ
jgi:hypothetical protein